MSVSDKNTYSREEKNQDSQQAENSSPDQRQDFYPLPEEFARKYTQFIGEEIEARRRIEVSQSEQLGTAIGIIAALHYQKSYIQTFNQFTRIQPGMNNTALSVLMAQIDKDINDLTLTIEGMKKKVEEIKLSVSTEKAEGGV